MINRSNSKPKKKDDWELSPEKQRKITTFIKNVPSLLIIIFVIGWFAWSIISINLDLAGEYNDTQPGHDTTRMSVMREGDGIVSTFTYGRSCTLVTHGKMPGEDERINWTYEVPENLQARGVRNRKVSFIGTVKPGTIDGIVQDGRKTFAIKLDRSLLATLFTKAQGLWPF